MIWLSHAAEMSKYLRDFVLNIGQCVASERAQRSPGCDRDPSYGVPAGILIGFEDPEAWWEELLLRDPRFRARVAQARSSLRDGQGISIEQLREKHSIKSQAPQAEE